MPKLCIEPQCAEKHYAKGWCIRHYTRQRRHGDSLLHNRNSTNYKAVHQRLGRASDHKCVCGRQAQEWSYRGDDPNELTQQGRYGSKELLLRYSLDARHYDALCKPCHISRDRRGAIQRGAQG
jgi:hypothetical protein